MKPQRNLRLEKTLSSLCRSVAEQMMRMVNVKDKSLFSVQCNNFSPNCWNN